MKTISKRKCLRLHLKLKLFGALLIATGLISSAQGIAALAQTKTVSTTTHLPVVKETIHPQTNETVRFGDAEAVFRVSFDPNGGTNIEVTGHLHGTGKGLASGRAYEFAGGGKIRLDSSTLPAPEFVLVCNGHLMAPGTSASQPITITLSMTINSAGEVNATVRELKAQP